MAGIGDLSRSLTPQKARGFGMTAWRKLLIKKIRGLLERARKWNAHEDGAGGLYERAVLEALEGFLRGRD
jgi:hypothetical protein